MSANRASIGRLAVTGSSAFQLNGLTDLRVDTGLSPQSIPGAGDTDPSYASVTRVAPMISGTTLDIKIFFDSISALTGLKIPTSTTYTSVEAYATIYEHLGAILAGSTHVKYVANECLIVPVELSVSDGQNATLTFEVHCSFDDSNAPLVRTGSVALPTATVLSDIWTLGPINVNGTAIDGVEAWSCNFGLRVEKRFGPTGIYPEYITIRRRDPTFRVTFEDEAALATFGLLGLAQTSSATEFYLRDRTKLGGVEADATTTHIKLSLSSTQGLHLAGGFGGGNDGLSSGELQTVAISGAGAILTVNTASAIT